MKFIPAFMRPTFVPSGAPAKPSPAKSGRDPRDGDAPPPLPAQSPANPLAVAQLLSGNPNLTIAQIPQVLGAPIAQLIADTSSILYGGRALKAEARRTKASGAPAADGKVAVLAPYIPPAMAKGTVATKPAEKTTHTPSSRDAQALAWVLAQLARFGVTCERWTAMSDEAAPSVAASSRRCGGHGVADEATARRSAPSSPGTCSQSAAPPSNGRHGAYSLCLMRG